MNRRELLTAAVIGIPAAGFMELQAQVPAEPKSGAECAGF